jgi:hypothetical protein
MYNQHLNHLFRPASFFLDLFFIFYFFGGLKENWKIWERSDFGGFQLGEVREIKKEIKKICQICIFSVIQTYTMKDD